MPQIEHRFVSAERADIKTQAAADGKPSKLTGLAAPYYDGTVRTEYELWPGVMERIMPGALAESAAADDVRGLFNHDPNLLLSRTSSKTLRLTDGPTGLAYEMDLADTQAGRDVHTHIQRGDVTGSSFGFVVTKETWLDDQARNVQIRQIEQATLRDVGPVTFPAYKASQAAVRDESDLAEARSAYKEYCATRWADQRRRLARRLKARLLEIEANA